MRYVRKQGQTIIDFKLFKDFSDCSHIHKTTLLHAAINMTELQLSQKPNCRPAQLVISMLSTLHLVGVSVVGVSCLQLAAKSYYYVTKLGFENV